MERLTVEEERELLLVAKTDKDAREKLALHLDAYANSIAFSYKKTHPSFVDDILQEARVGILEAAMKYDLSYDVRFISYASIWITNKIYLLLKSHTKHANAHSFYELHDDLDNLESDVDHLANMFNKDFMNKFNELISTRLTSREKDILYKRYYSDDQATFRDLGARYGISGARVEQVEKRMFEKLRNDKFKRQYYGKS